MIVTVNGKLMYPLVIFCFDNFLKIIQRIKNYALTVKICFTQICSHILPFYHIWKNTHPL